MARATMFLLCTLVLFGTLALIQVKTKLKKLPVFPHFWNPIILDFTSKALRIARTLFPLSSWSGHDLRDKHSLHFSTTRIKKALIKYLYMHICCMWCLNIFGDIKSDNSVWNEQLVFQAKELDLEGDLKVVTHKVYFEVEIGGKPVGKALLTT